MFLMSYRISAFVFGLLSLTAQTAHAAGGEMTAYGGGVTFDGGVGSHALVGVRGGWNANDKLTVFGEFSWTRLLSQSFSGSGVNANASANLASYGGGVSYGFSSSKKIVPYMLASFGVGHFYTTGSATSGGSSSSVSLSITNAAYVGLGGGARVYVGKNWGICPEFRYQRYVSSLFSANAATYTAGVFWHSGK